MLIFNDWRDINFYDLETKKDVNIDVDQVLEVDDRLGRLLLTHFPALKELNSSYKPKEEKIEDKQKGGDPDIKKMEDEERYVCANCDEHFGKGKYKDYRNHLKIHA